MHENNRSRSSSTSLGNDQESPIEAPASASASALVELEDSASSIDILNATNSSLTRHASDGQLFVEEEFGKLDSLSTTLNNFGSRSCGAIVYNHDHAAEHAVLRNDDNDDDDQEVVSKKELDAPVHKHKSNNINNNKLEASSAASHVNMSEKEAPHGNIVVSAASNRMASRSSSKTAPPVDMDRQSSLDEETRQVTKSLHAMAVEQVAPIPSQETQQQSTTTSTSSSSPSPPESIPGAYATRGRAPYTNTLLSPRVLAPPSERRAASGAAVPIRTSRSFDSTVEPDSPVTAVCVDHDDLENKIREEIIQSSSRADVIHVENDDDDNLSIDTILEKTRRRYACCACLFAIIMCLVVGLVVSQNNNNSGANMEMKQQQPEAASDEELLREGAEEGKDHEKPSKYYDPNAAKATSFPLEWSLRQIREKDYLACGVVGDPSWDEYVNSQIPSKSDDDDKGGGGGGGNRQLLLLRQDLNHRYLQKDTTTTTTGKPSDSGFIWGKRDPMDVVFANLLQWEQDKLLDRAASGKEYDICRALGAAILGKGGESKVYIAHAWDWHTSIYQDKMDIYVGTLRPTIGNDMLVMERLKGFTFSTPYYYQGLRFAGDPESVQCAEALSLGGDPLLDQQCNQTRICARETSLSLDDNTILPGLGEIPSSQIVPLDPEEDILLALTNGTCDAVADYAPALDEERARQAGFSGEYIVGNALISKEPLTIDTYDSIEELSTFLNWILLALFAAGRRGISKSNSLDFPRTSYLGQGNEDTFRNALEAVGNINDIFLRDKNILEAGLAPIDDQISGALMAHPLGPARNDGLDLTTKSPRVGEILKRGSLRCAVRVNRLGFAVRLEDGLSTTYTGFDIDFCRALAAAVFEEEEELPLELIEIETLGEGFALLSSNEADVVAGATWTLQNDIDEPETAQSYIFSQPYFYLPSDDDDDDNVSDLDLDANLCLVASGADQYWGSMIQWTVMATLHAEAHGVGMEESHMIPSVGSFGGSFSRFFQRVVAEVGNYDEIYDRNLSWLLPRSGRNLLNKNPQRTIQGPSVYVPPGLEV